MISHQVISLTACTVLIISMIGFGSAVQLTIEPQLFNELTDNYLNMTCTGAGPAYWAKTVLYIQITKQGQVNPLINISKVNGITMGPKSKENMKAEGHIDKDASKSFLTLTIRNPDIEDTGSYMCQMFFIDERFQMIAENVTADVAFYEQSIKDVVTNLMEEVSGLKQDVEKQGDFISQQNDTILEQERQLIVCKNHHSKQERQFDTLKDFITKQFNATNIRQNKQVDALKDLIDKQNDTIIRQKQQVDELKETSSEKQKQLNSLMDDNSRQEQIIDDLINLINKQNDTIVNQKQQVDKLEESSSEKEQQFNLVMGANSRQKQQLGILEELINKQNVAFENLKVQLRKHTILMHKQVCVGTKVAYYEGEQTCLKAFDEKLTWSQSREKCQALGGDLVQIRDEEKNNFVFNLLGNIGDVWIGMRRFDKDFKYLDGSTFTDNFDPWYEGEPNNSGGNEDCVVTIATYAGKWNDLNCSTKRSYACSILSRRIGIF